MHIIWAISKLGGGGAEHVMFQLANYMQQAGSENEILVTNQGNVETNYYGASTKIPCTFIEGKKNKFNLSVLILQLTCKVFEKLHIKIPFALQHATFEKIYDDELKAIACFLKERKDAVIVAFLHPTDQLMMMAAKQFKNPIIVSERADPIRYFEKKYTKMFLDLYYPLIDGMVFQTPNAMQCYPENVQKKGTVILNPVSGLLPNRYDGKREKIIVNFCRLSAQKNLYLLIDAFEIFFESHQDYLLRIYGNGELEAEIRSYAASKKSGKRIQILPHRDDIHEVIRSYAMFVSSSDFEGVSNSMLEAMAIGLPVVCTDCPIGGAAYVIEDHINGILVPLNNAERMATAMAEIADNPELAKILSINSVKLKEQLSIESIGNQWLSYISERCGS